MFCVEDVSVNEIVVVFFLFQQVEVYDPKTKVWTKGTAMQCKRSAVGVAALDDRVYICGGYDGITSLSTVECYYPKTDSWSTVRVSFITSKRCGQLKFICIYAGCTNDEVPFSWWRC